MARIAKLEFNMPTRCELVLPAIVGALISIAPSSPAQGRWVQRYPSTNPPAARAHRMVFDAARDRTVMFGGRNDSGLAAPVVWVWNGVNWSSIAASPGPTARTGHGMAFDSARRSTVLFGGSDANGLRNDTWEWNGTRWTQRLVAGPSPRTAPHMAFDSARGTVVLQGGWNGAPLFDTWEWDGTTWTRRFPSREPPARSGAVTFDAASGRTVLFGGIAGDPAVTPVAETWEWDGANWTQRNPSNSPGPRSNCAMAFDSARGRAVLFGGSPGSNVELEDTWEWDGNDWHRNAGATRHPATMLDMAFDSTRGVVVSFGGHANGTYLGLTWEYVADPVASLEVFGQGCPGTVGVPTLTAAPGQLPIIGRTFALELHSLPDPTTAFGILGRSNTMFQSLSLPTSLAVIGMPGCDLLVSPEVSYQLPTLNGSGVWLVHIPNIPGLGGEQLYVQGLVTDPGANALGATVTNAIEGTIGLVR